MVLCTWLRPLTWRTDGDTMWLVSCNPTLSCLISAFARAAARAAAEAGEEAEHGDDSGERIEEEPAETVCHRAPLGECGLGVAAVAQMVTFVVLAINILARGFSFVR